MRSVPFRRAIPAAVGFTLTCLLATSMIRAVEPGVDIAAPRVAITSAGASGLTFTPSLIRIESGDYVRWKWVSGSHTTTSGPPCAASGLWTSGLNSTVPMFTRQFLETPGTFPFFCQPHCGSGMRGDVVVTSLIRLDVTDMAGSTQLAWSGGSGVYSVFRGTTPLFATGTQTLTPAGGTTQTAFLDQTGGTPPVGGAFFYLVMNQF